ncbi:hypothetical protein [Streptomyces tubercidicus]|uniref:hypothetical protein n=1 Tax=Streptomyces tubercidicus TaxID=47759 RepID=UPI003691EB67
MTPDVVFEKLPPSPRITPTASIRHTEIVAQLRARPNEWARIQERDKPGDAAGVAYQIRKGILAAFRPAGHFEAKSRTVNDTFCVYARYVGRATNTLLDPESDRI